MRTNLVKHVFSDSLYDVTGYTKLIFSSHKARTEPNKNCSDRVKNAFK